MSTRPSIRNGLIHVLCCAAAILAVTGYAAEVHARQNIRDAFFAVYPDALGSVLDTVPSHETHCGVCHYAFGGAGTRNPYGVRLGEALDGFPNTDQGRQDAVLSIENEDSDGDGYSNLIEVTDIINYSNTPTFPGLTPANVGNVSEVDLADILDRLIPTTGGDTTPPEVEVFEPNGGETLTANAGTTVSWVATDPSNVISVDLYFSEDGGSEFRAVVFGLGNTGI